MTGDNVVKDTVVVAWLMWLKTVLEGTSGPLEKLTLWLCAAQWKLEHKPMAILYAAQGFARIAPTTFHLHCGFSDSMCEDIVSHEAVAEMKKTPGPPLLTQKEEAFENFTLGWNRSLPSRTVRSPSTLLISLHTFRHPSGSPSRLSATAGARPPLRRGNKL